MLKRFSLFFLLFTFLVLFIATGSPAAAQLNEDSPAVQAILFYSPTCPHCHQVITEFLIPLQETYGDQLQILGVDTSDATGQTLYKMAVDYYQIPDNRIGVPTLIVGNTILVGSGEIPEQFLGILEDGLLAGGIGWPDIPNLDLIVPDLPPSADPAATANTETEPVTEDIKAATEAVAPAADAAASANTTTAAPTAVPAAAAGQSLEEASQEISNAGTAPETASDPPADPLGFVLAWIVLIGMVGGLMYALRQIVTAWPLLSSNSYANHMSRLVPLLALLGLGVASYLAYVEMTHVEAICGPVGECNIVQSSSYAVLFGVPIAVWGLLDYLAILALWAGQRFLSVKTASWSSFALILLAVFGTLFSIYLTSLELFAIKAICLWCLSSAVITTLIMILATKNIPDKVLPVHLAAQPNP
ncbi:MAG: vitamin K epoxide reductase family protein [Candidatus Promineifilaceae bacterium]